VMVNSLDPDRIRIRKEANSHEIFDSMQSASS
jgi:hypothetical protein